MTRGATRPASGAASCARGPDCRYARIDGAMKAPRTAAAVTSARYNMGFNSARCLTRCDFSRGDFLPCDLGHYDLGHCDLSHSDLSHSDLGHSDLGPL